MRIDNRSLIKRYTYTQGETKKKPDCINHAVGTMPIGKPLAHRTLQHLKPGKGPGPDFICPELMSMLELL